MEDLGEALLGASDVEHSESFAVFSQTLDARWVAQALEATGTATVRRRKLPAEYVVWLVIGMALLRDRSIAAVVDHLSLVLPGIDPPAGHEHVTSGAIVQARDRLGVAPLKTLFSQTADRWTQASADQHRWRGLSIYGIDGTTMRVADTEENEAAFGRPASGRGEGGGYPQLRLVALMVLRSHLLAGVAFGHLRQGETTLAEALHPKVPDHSLTIVDRGFLSYRLFHQIQGQGADRHWLTRAKSNLKWRVVRSLGRGDDLIELPIHRNARRQHPDLPETLVARAIAYQRKGHRPQVLLTSLLDPEAYPSAEVIELYHERWELEIGFGEVKTRTLERAECLRSKAPERVEQEVWGLVLGYNLVRFEMERAAERVGLPPTRFSYRNALLAIRFFWLSGWTVSPGTLPKHLDRLHEQLAQLVLPPRRARSYPRAVKVKMSNYPLKRRGSGRSDAN